MSDGRKVCVALIIGHLLCLCLTLGIVLKTPRCVSGTSNAERISLGRGVMAWRVKRPKPFDIPIRIAWEQGLAVQTFTHGTNHQIEISEGALWLLHRIDIPKTIGGPYHVFDEKKGVITIDNLSKMGDGYKQGRPFSFDVALFVTGFRGELWQKRTVLVSAGVSPLLNPDLLWLARVFAIVDEDGVFAIKLVEDKRGTRWGTGD